MVDGMQVRACHFLLRVRSLTRMHWLDIQIALPSAALGMRNIYNTCTT